MLLFSSLQTLQLSTALSYTHLLTINSDPS
jgi:hypothetical protein